jgi:hypothetical protein
MLLVVAGVAPNEVVTADYNAQNEIHVFRTRSNHSGVNQRGVRRP